MSVTLVSLRVFCSNQATLPATQTRSAAKMHGTAPHVAPSSDTHSARTRTRSPALLTRYAQPPPHDGITLGHPREDHRHA